MRINCCFKFLFQEEFEKQKKDLAEKLNDNEKIQNTDTLMDSMTNPMMSEVTEIENFSDEKIGIENIDLKKYFPDSKIEELINFYLTQLEEDPKKDFKKLGSKKKNNLLNCDVYAKFTNKENSKNKIHKLYCEVQWNYPIKNILFFDLNNTKLINDKVEISKILNIQKSENGTLRYLKYTKSKKILIIQPRHTLDIFALKKLPNGNFIEIGLCVSKTHFWTNPDVLDFTSKIDKDLFVSNLISVNEYVLQDGFCLQKVFKISDPNTGVGFTLLKGVIKKSSFKFFERFGRFLEEFYESIKNGELDVMDDEGFKALREFREVVTQGYLLKDN